MSGTNPYDAFLGQYAAAAAASAAAGSAQAQQQQQQQQQAQQAQLQQETLAALQQQEAVALQNAQLYLAQQQQQQQQQQAQQAQQAASAGGATGPYASLLGAAAGLDGASYAQLLQAAGLDLGGVVGAGGDVYQGGTQQHHHHHQQQQHQAFSDFAQIQQGQEQLLAALQGGNADAGAAALPAAATSNTTAIGAGRPISLSDADRAVHDLLRRQQQLEDQADQALLAQYQQVQQQQQAQQQQQVQQSPNPNPNPNQNPGSTDYSTILGQLMNEQAQQQAQQQQAQQQQAQQQHALAHQVAFSASTSPAIATAASPATAGPPSKRANQQPSAPPGPLPEWYDKCTDLGLPEDKFWLSELQCYLRSNFCEVFGATERDIQIHAYSGRNKPLVLGQVGIRCKFCKDAPLGARGPQSVSYPSQLTGVYNSVQQMFRLHVDACQCIPEDVRRKLEELKDASATRGGRKQYWIDSAKRLGLCDTEHGIHFARDPTKPPPSMDIEVQPPPPNDTTAETELTAKAGPDGDKDEEEAVSERKKTAPAGNEGGGANDKGDDMEMEGEGADGQGSSTSPTRGKYISPDSGWEKAVLNEKKNAYPLVLEEDSPLISDYLYLTMQQMQPCQMMGPDRVGCYKSRPLGFRGLACRHCIGQAGSGRYFPASEASLSQTTTSQTILNHVRNCRSVPDAIRQELEDMKNSKIGEKGKKIGKPKHGGRKVFFHRLWCRVQGLPNREKVVGIGSGRKKGARKRGAIRPEERKKKDNDSSDDSSLVDSDGTLSEEEDDIGKNMTAFSNLAKALVDNGDGSESDDFDSSGDEVVLCYSCIDSNAAGGDDGEDADFSWTGTGGVRLAKVDDPLFLTEMECFMRGEMLEAFSSQVGTDEVQPGQAGVRCVYCAEAAPECRTEEYECYPPSLSKFYDVVTKFHHQHFKICPNIPEDIKATFISLKGIDSRDETEAREFWVDSARELGLSDHPKTTGHRRPFLSFHRDPFLPSPADDLASGRLDGSSKNEQESLLIRPDDKGMVTDAASLLLRQVKYCRFKSSDRRNGLGARGRDRALGFAGLACIHCQERKNNIGRYFPLTSKHLADSTSKTITSHIQNCKSCPEAIKASLAYLQHRSNLQKKEIGSTWKKEFFERVFDRMHNETWGRKKSRSSSKDEDGSKRPRSSPKRQRKRDDAGNGNDSDSDSGSGNGEVFDDEYIQREMGDMIHRAALWLTAEDNAAGRSRGRGARGGRAYPVRSLPTAGQGTGLPKRARLG